MEMQSLGTVQVDLRVFRRMVSCDVRTESTGANELALTEVSGLRRGLQKLGYRVQAIRCVVSPDTSADRDGAAAGLFPVELAQVNMVV
jgi:hypothetical protein